MSWKSEQWWSYCQILLITYTSWLFCLISSTTHEAMSYSTIEDKERFELFVVSKINPQYTEEDLHAVVAFCHFLSLPAMSSHPEVLDLASTGVNPLHTVSSNWPLSVSEVVFKPSMVFSCVQLKAAERGWTKIESELYFLLSCQSIERWKFCICDLSRRNIVHNFTCQQKFPGSCYACLDTEEMPQHIY